MICVKCGGKLVERTNRITQQKFWGCENFPDCRGGGGSVVKNNKCNRYRIGCGQRDAWDDRDGWEYY